MACILISLWLVSLYLALMDRGKPGFNLENELPRWEKGKSEPCLKRSIPQNGNKKRGYWQCLSTREHLCYFCCYSSTKLIYRFVIDKRISIKNENRIWYKARNSWKYVDTFFCEMRTNHWSLLLLVTVSICMRWNLDIMTWTDNSTNAFRSSLLLLHLEWLFILWLPYFDLRKMLSKVAWMSFCSAKFSPCADAFCWENTHLCSWGKYLSCLIISAIRAKILTVCGITENFAHCLGWSRVTFGRSHGNMATWSPKAVSKILSDTADGENFGTNGRNYQTR